MQIGRAFLVAVIWQSGAVALTALVAATLSGMQGVVSALLGGGIGVIGVLVFGLMSRGGDSCPSAAIRVALRAEAAKIVAIVVLLWLSFAVYREMVVPAFIGAFIMSVLLSGVAFAVSDN
jgi:ATP synthase protein I